MIPSLFRLLAPVLVLAGLFWSPAATASARPDAPAAFAASAVADIDLAAMTGTQLRRDAVANLADTQARDDFRQTSAVGTLALDNWFADVGSELILSNLLRQP